MEAIETAAMTEMELQPLRLEDLPDRLIRGARDGRALSSRWQTLVEELCVEFVVALESAAAAWKKRSRTRPTWFSTSGPFSHPDAGVQATGSTRWCGPIWKEAAIVLAILADEDGNLNRRLHVYRIRLRPQRP